MLQFSTECRTEVALPEGDAAPLHVDVDAFDHAVANMQRLNGGTNISAPLRCARSAARGAPLGSGWRATCLLSQCPLRR